MKRPNYRRKRTRLKAQLLTNAIHRDAALAADARELLTDWPAWVQGGLLYEVAIRNGYDDGEYVVEAVQEVTGNVASRKRVGDAAYAEARRLARNAKRGLVDLRGVAA